LIRAESAQAFILSYVHDYFTQRGVRFPFDCAAPSLQTEPRSRTDHQRKLEWLEACVRPMISKLAACGKLPEVLTALGLSQAECDQFLDLKLGQPQSQFSRRRLA
jgi:hypothetical protein